MSNKDEMDANNNKVECLINLINNLPISITSKLKDHQVEGIKFVMSQFQQGCILAHSMGLGKTLQAISCCYLMITQKNLHKILFLTPVNVIENLMAEFKYWLPNNEIQFFALKESKKLCISRFNEIDTWQKSSGVLIIGYERYRALVGPNQRIKKTEDVARMNTIRAALSNPDVIFCDEGHRIKNSEMELSRVLKQISTTRRIVLTGYPIQNNLLEYWTMVDFVRPKHLHERSTFQSLFETPILVGLCVDSTADEIWLMQQRLHILHLKLEQCVHRMPHSMLKGSLPEKTEYVFLLTMTSFQKTLYENLINHDLNTFEFFCTSMKIINHPDLLHDYVKKDCSYEWASELFANYTINEIDSSMKMQIFLCILNESISIGDKILVFSHSLDTLNIIEKFLKSSSDYKWLKNFSYFRLDGSTTPSERQKLINGFNSNDNIKLFLISTKAGSLGTNIIGANRVVLFDVSWNPCHDAQAVCRIYRYGQQKHCFTYRLITDCTFEKKVFDRQINKQTLSLNIVDKQNILPYLSKSELTDLLVHSNSYLNNKENVEYQSEKYVDTVMQKVVKKFSYLLSREPIEFDSFFIENQHGQLKEDEKIIAEKDYNTQYKLLNNINKCTKK